MVVAHGIDVSSHQGIIDWETVKDHIDFAIIRCGYGQDRVDQDDRMFRRNADECTRLNIPFGVYLYSYARSINDALSEARHVVRLVAGYKMAYPVYYDLEDETTTGRQSNDVIANIAKTFCDYLEVHGYYTGIYASLYWWRTKLTSPIFNRYTRWVANYAAELNFSKSYDMWQYSSTGWVQGITGNVDLNYAYKDFPALIRRLGMNGFSNDNSEDETNTGLRYQVGDEVRFNYVFLTSDSTTPLRPYRNMGVITRIEPNTRNPYLIGNNQGWVNDQVIEGRGRTLSNPNYQGTSFVDALRQIGEDTSYENRRRLANLNGIYNYQGSQRQNMELLELLKEGKLIS